MSETLEAEVTRLRAAIYAALGQIAASETLTAIVTLERALEPPVPGGQAEPPATTAQREYEKRVARERCNVTVGGHLFHVSRAYCARCFEPKPPGWGS